MFRSAMLLGLAVSTTHAMKESVEKSENDASDNEFLVSEGITQDLLSDNCQGMFTMLDRLQKDRETAKPGHCFKVSGIPGRNHPIILMGTCHHTPVDAYESFFKSFRELLIGHGVRKVFFEVDYTNPDVAKQATEENWAKILFDYGLYLRINDMKDIEIDYLETYEEQQYVLATLRRSDEATATATAIRDIQVQKSLKTKELMAANSWLNGNRQAFWAMCENFALAWNPVGEELRKTMWVDRNRKWRETLSPEALEDQSLAVIVGTTHLYGPTGLLKFYMDLDATVEILDGVWSTVPPPASIPSDWTRSVQELTGHLKAQRDHLDFLEAIVKCIVVGQAISFVPDKQLHDRTREMLRRIYFQHDQDARKILERAAEEGGYTITL